MAPNKPVLRKWVAALRSGNYKQAKGELRVQSADEGDRFCCLGVLCEIAVVDHVIPWYNRSSGALPMQVVDWAGVGDPDPLLDAVTVSHRATQWNDTHGLTFDEIGDLIEFTFDLKEQ